MSRSTGTQRLNPEEAPPPLAQDLDPDFARECGLDPDRLEALDAVPGFLGDLADHLQAGALSALEEVRRRTHQAQQALKDLTNAERHIQARQGQAEVLRRVDALKAAERENQAVETEFRDALFGMMPFLDRLREADHRLQEAITEVHITAREVGVILDPTPGVPLAPGQTALPRGRRVKFQRPARDWMRGVAYVLGQEGRRLEGGS